MTRESSDEETVDTPAEKKPRLTLVIILSIVIGMLLMFSIGSTVLGMQSRKALEAQLTASKNELKSKTQLLAEAQEQIASLSQQVHSLRDFSVAKASAVAATTAGETPAPAPASSPSSPPAPAEAEKGKAKPAGAPAAKKAKMAGQDCQLVGKSQEEQAATLKRCMQALDGR